MFKIAHPGWRREAAWTTETSRKVDAQQLRIDR